MNGKSLILNNIKLTIKKDYFILLMQSIIYLLVYLLTIKMFFGNDGIIEKVAILILATFSLLIKIYDTSFNKSEVQTLILLFILFLSLFLSYTINNNTARILGDFNTIILYMYIFIVLPRYGLLKFNEYFITIFIMIFSILPVCLFYLGYLDYNVTNGFSGFGEHRNHYALISGFLFFIVWFYWKENIKYIILLLLLMGLWLSGSRGSWIALIFGIWSYINFNNKLTIKNIARNLFLIVVIYMVYEFYMMYKYDIQPHGDKHRIVIIELFIQSIFDNFFFGVGKNLFFELEIFNSNVYAHNFILQIFANYGFFTLIIFSIFMIKQIKQLSIKGKVIIIYIFIVGLFQPLFDVRFNAYYLMSLLILMYYEKEGKSYQSK